MSLYDDLLRVDATTQQVAAAERQRVGIRRQPHWLYAWTNDHLIKAGLPYYKIGMTRHPRVENRTGKHVQIVWRKRSMLDDTVLHDWLKDYGYPPLQRDLHPSIYGVEWHAIEGDVALKLQLLAMCLERDIFHPMNRYRFQRWRGSDEYRRLFDDGDDSLYSDRLLRVRFFKPAPEEWVIKIPDDQVENALDDLLQPPPRLPIKWSP